MDAEYVLSIGLSECNYVGVSDCQDRKKKNTVEVLEGKCATVDFGKHFSKLP